ncbi:MAG: phosphatase PAP2 family protein [bacterium]
MLYAESAAFTLALTQLTKAAFRRPRPYTYLDGAPAELDSDASLSFFSGHTALAFALAGTAGYLALTRRSDGSGKYWTLAGTATLAVGTAWLRVASRQHFVTDVLAGAAVGGSVGILVPHLHRVERGGSVQATPAMLSLGGAF